MDACEPMRSLILRHVLISFILHAWFTQETVGARIPSVAWVGSAMVHRNSSTAAQMSPSDEWVHQLPLPQRCHPPRPLAAQPRLLPHRGRRVPHRDRRDAGRWMSSLVTRRWTNGVKWIARMAFALHLTANASISNFIDRGFNTCRKRLC